MGESIKPYPTEQIAGYTIDGRTEEERVGSWFCGSNRTPSKVNSWMVGAGVLMISLLVVGILAYHRVGAFGAVANLPKEVFIIAGVVAGVALITLIAASPLIRTAARYTKQSGETEKFASFFIGLRKLLDEKIPKDPTFRDELIAIAKEELAQTDESRAINTILSTLLTEFSDGLDDLDSSEYESTKNEFRSELRSQIAVLREAPNESPDLGRIGRGYRMLAEQQGQANLSEDRDDLTGRQHEIITIDQGAPSSADDASSSTSVPSSEFVPEAVVNFKNLAMERIRAQPRRALKANHRQYLSSLERLRMYGDVLCQDEYICYLPKGSTTVRYYVFPGILTEHNQAFLDNPGLREVKPEELKRRLENRDPNNEVFASWEEASSYRCHLKANEYLIYLNDKGKGRDAEVL